MLLTHAAIATRAGVRAPQARVAGRQRGFTLIELMVTVAIALFLLGGLLTIVGNVRSTWINQQSLATLQDEERFAMTVLTDVIQAGGYLPDATAWVPDSALPSNPPFAAGQAFWGSQPGGNQDTLEVRYMTNPNDGVILCNGATNPGPAAHTYTNLFALQAPANGNPWQLTCSLDGAQAVPLVSGVQGMSIAYGVKRDFAIADYNVDTYLTFNQMQPADWGNISSVRVTLIFTNPLFGQQNQPATITFERIVAVMARAGVHT